MVVAEEGTPPGEALMLKVAMRSSSGFKLAGTLMGE
jgi:hypothetical protein